MINLYLALYLIFPVSVDMPLKTNLEYKWNELRFVIYAIVRKLFNVVKNNLNNPFL